jgi:hypothetical protein
MNNTQKQEYIGYKKYTWKELVLKTREANKELRNKLLEGDYYSQSPWLICISGYPSIIIAVEHKEVGIPNDKRLKFYGRYSQVRRIQKENNFKKVKDEIRYMNNRLRNGLIYMTIRAATIVVTGIILNHIRKSNKQ